MKKKHVLIVILALSVIVVPSVFAANGNPWLEVWNAISGLESRISILETSSISQNIIRFSDANEYIVVEGDGPTICSTFHWIPQNPDNNVILRLSGYLEQKGIMGTIHGSVPWPFKSDWQVDIYSGDNLISTNILGEEMIFYSNFDYFLSKVFISTGNVGPTDRPIYPEYTIVILIETSRGTAYYRNINIIIEVVDG